MSEDDFCIYFDEHLESSTECKNEKCHCLNVLSDPMLPALVVKYLVGFDRKPKQEQGCIISKWYKSASAGTGKKNWHLLPFNTNGDEHGATGLNKIWSHQICTLGMQTKMNLGVAPIKSIQSASNMGVIPPHDLKGKKPNWRSNDTWLPTLKQHFEYLLQLCEVRAMRTMASFVDGVHVGQINLLKRERIFEPS